MNKKSVFIFCACLLLCVGAFVLTVNGRLALGLMLYVIIGACMQLKCTKGGRWMVLSGFALSAVLEFVFVCVMHRFLFSQVVKDIFMTGLISGGMIALGILAVLLVQRAIKMVGCRL